MTEYRRCQGKSYMVISSDAAAAGYEYPMITENKIAGLLPVKILNVNEQVQYWYDISGRQALEDRMIINKGGSGLLKKLIVSLAEALDQISGYLLCEDGISLAPEKIFVDAEEKEIAFCYMPFQKEPFEDSLRSFMEYYISHMQHGRREDTQKCYEVYEKCQQSNVRTEELLQILFETETSETIPQTMETEPVKSEEKAQKILPKHQRKKLFELLLQKNTWIGNIFPFKKKHISAVPYAFEPKEENEPLSGSTVFLGSEIKETIGEFRYEGDGNEENLKITSSVFLIGSHREEADGIISDDTVSRIHARITKEADGYYLEDMNSTNGTYRNGEALSYKEKVKLEKNDRVSFAKESYRFV